MEKGPFPVIQGEVNFFLYFIFDYINRSIILSEIIIHICLLFNIILDEFDFKEKNEELGNLWYMFSFSSVLLNKFWYFHENISKLEGFFLDESWAALAETLLGNIIQENINKLTFVDKQKINMAYLSETTRILCFLSP